MEQGGPQARQFVNNINTASPLYKEDHKDIAPSDFDWLYTKEVEQDLFEHKLSVETTPKGTLKKMLKQCTEALYPPHQETMYIMI